MIVKPVESVCELLAFFTKRYNQMPEFMRFAIAQQGKLDLVEFLWTANLNLVNMRGINGLYFFYPKKDNKIPGGLGACYEYFPACIEILSFSINKFYLTHYKAINFYIDELDKGNWKRMQAFVYEKSNFYIKLLERKGFQKEGLIEKYDGKFNYYLMAKVN